MPPRRPAGSPRPSGSRCGARATAGRSPPAGSSAPSRVFVLSALDGRHPGRGPERQPEPGADGVGEGLRRLRPGRHRDAVRGRAARRHATRPQGHRSGVRRPSWPSTIATLKGLTVTDERPDRAGVRRDPGPRDRAAPGRARRHRPVRRPDRRDRSRATRTRSTSYLVPVRPAIAAIEADGPPRASTSTPSARR